MDTTIRNAIRMERKLKKIAGQQLQLLRLEKNLTQEQMSEKLNLSTSAYCKIEYGETDLTLTRLDKIAKVLDISALALFSHISKNMHSYSDNNNENENAVPNYDDLRELIKANSRIIDLLCKRIDLLEQHL
jgi:transcriptional regulator with XRE-family HTH domain